MNITPPGGWATANAKSIGPDRAARGGDRYEDVPGFAKAAAIEEVAAQDFVLSPGRYVGTREVDAEVEPFDGRMIRLTNSLREQMVDGSALDGHIRKALSGIGYGW